MKLLRCTRCGDAVALSKRWRSCECGASGGVYDDDGDRATIAGPCRLYGISNRLFLDLRAEAWPYDETNGKITRVETNVGNRTAARA